MSGLFLVFGLAGLVMGCGEGTEDSAESKVARKGTGEARREAQKESRKGNAAAKQSTTKGRPDRGPN